MMEVSKLGCAMWTVISSSIKMERKSTDVFQVWRAFFHSINGVMLPTYKFTEHGNYTISVEIAGILFIPIEPVFANFSAIAIPTTEKKMELKLSSS